MSVPHVCKHTVSGASWGRWVKQCSLFFWVEGVDPDLVRGSNHSTDIEILHQHQCVNYDPTFAFTVAFAYW